MVMCASCPAAKGAHANATSRSVKSMQLRARSPQGCRLGRLATIGQSLRLAHRAGAHIHARVVRSGKDILVDAHTVLRAGGMHHIPVAITVEVAGQTDM